jgi:hypothetical protein
MYCSNVQPYDTFCIDVLLLHRLQSRGNSIIMVTNKFSLLFSSCYVIWYSIIWPQCNIHFKYKPIRYCYLHWLSLTSATCFGPYLGPPSSSLIKYASCYCISVGICYILSGILCLGCICHFIFYFRWVFIVSVVQKAVPVSDFWYSFVISLVSGP